MKRLLFGSGAVVLLVCSFAGWRFSAWVDSPLPVTSETVFDVAPGSASWINPVLSAGMAD